MGLSQINDIDLMNEKKSLNKLFECSDSFTSVVFNSGAGSGKTYALIQLLMILERAKNTFPEFLKNIPESVF